MPNMFFLTVELELVLFLFVQITNIIFEEEYLIKLIIRTNKETCVFRVTYQKIFRW